MERIKDTLSPDVNPVILSIKKGRIGNVNNAELAKLAEQAKTGQLPTQVDKPSGIPLMPLEEAIARLTECGILTPEQGFGIVFKKQLPEKFEGNNCANFVN